MKTKERYLYIDNLRLLMIIFVVMVHLAVTYSGIGGWDYKEGATLDTISTVIFGYFLSFTQGYFMGFLFLIAGYFVPRAYDKKGFTQFLKDRLLRLGVPTLFYMLLINPIISLILNKIPLSKIPGLYLHYIISLEFISGSGPLWFAFALLIFSFLYALIRKLTKKTLPNINKNIPKNYLIFLLILIIAVASFTVRLVEPIDSSIMNLQFSFFSQYIILFILGINCYRFNWFSTFNYNKGRKWFISALTFGFIIWIIMMLTGGALTGGFNLYKGGLHMQSIAYALWEAYISVSMAIGLITIFREKFNRQTKLIQGLSDSSFGVYVFHAPVIIFMAIAFQSSILPPLAKFTILTLIALPLTFAITHYILKKIPLINKYI